MKVAFVAAFAIIGLATAGLAQEGNQSDAQMREQADALIQKYSHALNDGNCAVIGDLSLLGSLAVTPLGKVQDGKTDCHIPRKLHSMGFQETQRVADVQPAFGGQGLLVITAYSATFSAKLKIPPPHGYYLFVLQRVGDGWKVRAASATRLAPSPPPTSTR